MPTVVDAANPYSLGGLQIIDSTVGSGTGNYNTFLSVQNTGQGTTEQGFNLDKNGGFLDAGEGIFTHALQLSAVGDDGAGHYVFRLDVNEPNNSDGHVVLSDLQFFVSATGATTGNWDGSAVTGLTLIKAFTPDVDLNDHSHGSGTDDYLVLVDKSLFDGVDPGAYLTMYARFTEVQGGFEEFRAQPSTDGPGTGQSSISVDKHTVCADDPDHVVDFAKLLVDSEITWTYSVSNAGPGAAQLISFIDDNGTLDTADDFAPSYTGGDTDNDGILDAGETWTFAASGAVQHTSYFNTATATTTDVTKVVTETGASSGYTGIAAGIDIQKVTSGTGTDGKPTSGENPTLLAGTAVTWTYTVSNAATNDVGLTGVTVTDDKIPGLHLTTPNSGDVANIGVLDPGETWIFTATGTAAVGSYSNTGIVDADTVTDVCDNSKVIHDTDGAGYIGSFTQDKSGLTIGYWYTHQSQWAGITHATGGILLGDVNNNGLTDIGETTLFVPTAAAAQIINSSQTANDARQILMSQALAEQLNINNGTNDPGAGTGHLITEAVQWLRGQAPYTFSDGSTGNVDGNHNGILDKAEYDPTAKAPAFTTDGNGALAGTALTSNLKAWQSYTGYTSEHYDFNNLTAPKDNFLADGEGLKNALQAVNQNHLVTDPTGTVVAWNQSGSLTGPYEDFHLNGSNDFWAVLASEVDDPIYVVNASLLKGITPDIG